MNSPLSLSTTTVPGLGATTRRLKVFGKPLQGFYQALLAAPQAPSQPLVLKELSRRLAELGLRYHARTLKRQLRGNIRYVPELLEETLLSWVEASFPALFARLHPQWKKAKEALQKSEDQDLYVSPAFFIQMADAYLILHKNLSRRRLAIKLAEDLRRADFPIGLETLQAALAGKTLKIRTLVERQMLDYFFQEGRKNKQEVEAEVGRLARTASAQIDRADTAGLASQVDRFLLESGGLSKRRLAVELRLRLKEKGYLYHLSSLQSVLEGKTRRTRGIILQTLSEIFSSSVPLRDEGSSPLLQDLGGNHYVSAAEIPAIVAGIQEKFPTCTRRQLAARLRQELEKKGLRASLNTLQYILGGKTQRIRKVMLDVLKDLEKDPSLGVPLAPHSVSIAWIQALEKRVRESLELLRNASGADQETARIAFLEARSELIRESWLKYRRGHRARHAMSQGRRRPAWQEDPDASEESRFSEESSPTWESPDPFDRLVS